MKVEFDFLETLVTLIIERDTLPARLVKSKNLAAEKIPFSEIKYRFIIYQNAGPQLTYCMHLI